MTYATGQRVRVIDAANLPCQAGDTGTIAEVRQTARDFPIRVKLDGGHFECFRECELKPVGDPFPHPPTYGKG